MNCDPDTLFYELEWHSNDDYFKEVSQHRHKWLILVAMRHGLQSDEELQDMIIRNKYNKIFVKYGFHEVSPTYDEYVNNQKQTHFTIVFQNTHTRAESSTLHIMCGIDIEQNRVFYQGFSKKSFYNSGQKLNIKFLHSM